jgi:hypothetical protein
LSKRNQVLAGLEAIGQLSGKVSSRPFSLYAKDITSIEQAVPLRLVFGQARVSGVQITPIFGFRNEQVTTKAGK